MLVETSLMHWAHGIKDTNILDVIRDDYLFGMYGFSPGISIARTV